MNSPSRLSLLFLLLALVPSALPASPRTSGRSAPPRTHLLDFQRRIDVNQVNMVVTNNGSFAWDLQAAGFPPGLVFPRGSGKTAVFASGLWVGGVVGSDIRMAVAEYNQEYGPGPIVSGFPQDGLEHHVYKVVPWSGNPDDTAHVVRTPAELAADPDLDDLAHHSWSEYLAGAAPFGAPVRMHRLPATSTPAPDDSVDVPGPDVVGDMMLWSVYNDADPSLHFAGPGSTAPLGIEVQQTTFAFVDNGALGNTVFVRFKIIHKGTQTVEGASVSIWSDPDVGAATDDLVGTDVPLGMGYAYNGNFMDGIYGSHPPAVGFQLLRGPGTGAGGPLTAMGKYINGTDPSSALAGYYAMNGLLANGSPVLDPTNGLPTTYYHPGDPLTGSGWIDSNPADRRLLASSSGFTLDPGDTTELVGAVVLVQGVDHLASVGSLRCLARDVRTAFQQGFTRPFPNEGCGEQALNCPRTSDYWALECAPGTQDLTDSQMLTIAANVAQQVRIFEWDGTEVESFCGTIGATGDPRALAKREFAALIANVQAGTYRIGPPGGSPILLNPLTTIACPGLEATTIGELIRPAPVNGLYDADYRNLVADHPRALEGVNAGFPFFQGGAGVAFDFFGSTLDPTTQPDSFPAVEIRFSHSETQKAYRYLRLERQSDGVAPPQGRAYLYGGHRDVNFTCWDVTNGRQLDVAFVERCVTDDFGTILDPSQQFATFDSTWAPGPDGVGAREYLFVLARPYSPTPKFFFEVDGGVADASQPQLYALWSKLRFEDSVIDDGDRFDFLFGEPASPGVDQDLMALEGQPLSDPAVAQRYQRIAECLWAINRGIGIGPICDEPTAVEASLIDSEIRDGRVRLRWHLGGAPAATVQRHAPEGEWTPVAQRVADASGVVTYEDSDLTAGGRYGYRLALMDGGTEVLAGETWVEVGGPVVELALEGVRPNPSPGALDVALVLPARGPGSLELLDVAGRRVAAADLGGLAPGRHVLRLDAGGRAPAGIYLVRLTHGGRRLTTKAAILR